MRSNQPIADVLLWDCDDHLENEGGNGLYKMGRGKTKTYLKQLFEDINGISRYGRVFSLRPNFGPKSRMRRKDRIILFKAQFWPKEPDSTL
jgi:hypothetical protein